MNSLDDDAMRESSNRKHETVERVLLLSRITLLRTQAARDIVQQCNIPWLVLDLHRKATSRHQ